MNTTEINIPRYSLGRQYVKTGSSKGYGIPAIIQSEAGQYVKYSDYLELLDAFNQYVKRKEQS